MSPLGAYLFAAIVAWTHVPSPLACHHESATCRAWAKWHEDERPMVSRARYRVIASQIARSGADADEALALAAIAVRESGLLLSVDSLACNRAEYVGALCNGKRTWTIFQLKLFGREKAPRDRQEAIHRSLLLYRRKPGAWATIVAARAMVAAWEREHPLVTLEERGWSD